MSISRQRIAVACLAALAASAATAQTPQTTNVYWGDLHLHSNYSIDAYATGNTSVTPDMAYRYARGNPILHPITHTKVKSRRPLDFLAVTDHAENLGADVMLDKHDAQFAATEWGRRLQAQHDQPGWRGFMRGQANGPQRAAMMK